MDDFEKKLADIESAYIQGLITLDEYEKSMSDLERNQGCSRFHQSEWDSSGLCGVSAFSPLDNIVDNIIKIKPIDPFRPNKPKHFEAVAYLKGGHHD